MEIYKRPKDIVRIPSLGKLYQKKEETIEVYYLDGEDEDIITSPSLAGNSSLIYNELLKLKIVDKTINIKNLIPADRDKIILFLRINAYGSIYKFTYVDPYLDEEFECEVDLLKDTVEKTLNEDPDENGLFTITITENDILNELNSEEFRNIEQYQLLNKDIKFKLLTIGDYSRIEDEVLNISKSKNEKTKYATRFLREQIFSVNGETDKSKIEMMLKTTSMVERVVLRNKIKKISPSITIEKEVRGPSGQFFRVEPSFDIKFIYPFKNL